MRRPLAVEEAVVEKTVGCTCSGAVSISPMQKAYKQCIKAKV